ncbi:MULTISPECIES: LysR substrate-binding domain-containing protein [unclassified Ensifer]|uniref:LysR substrate-binding domain-containing protein n=1 Tax=unclassified Ensifer TaxID=2633371 RepID=UPI000812C274|nr:MULTISPECIES: LysR substrate-binding domain-containing protein [unclassified Ensifer]OCP19872.1 LysR family transcriptional regulator [Ensifer sp. LC384]OCP20517.1 LysR family transcriptional regulator [Ensifer sp. LC54]
MQTLDPDLLRTFLAFAESGSLAHAATVVGRTPSAVTSQMQRLEALIGEALLAPSGRGRVLTPAGEDLVVHARKILDAHRDAWLSLRGARTDGRVSLGCTQDFADSTLPALLQQFAGAHPRVRLDLRVGRSKELVSQYDQGAVDVMIVMRQGGAVDEIAVLCEPMVWLCASPDVMLADEQLPLAVLDPPCGFRSAAVDALETSGRPYRIAATSPSLSGLRAAVRSGIALTARTERFVGEGVAIAPERLALPTLPDAEFSLRLKTGAERAAATLAALLADGLSKTIAAP